jgi:hypothetical protein
MLEGMELVSNLITRYAIFEGLYLQTTSAAKDQLSQSMVKLYAAVLKYLSNARCYYDRNTARSFSHPLLHHAQHTNQILKSVWQ